tara:strand:+ start:169 stop:366 length:198 start_codon:yes stop_codon:yes gene_type:complete
MAFVDKMHLSTFILLLSLVISPYLVISNIYFFSITLIFALSSALRVKICVFLEKDFNKPRSPVTM